MMVYVLAFFPFSMISVLLFWSCGKKKNGGGGVKNIPNDSTASKQQPTDKPSDLKPKVLPKNEKEKMIAKGDLKKGKNDYPTMDDVVSDWDSEDDKDGNKKKKK